MSGRLVAGPEFATNDAQATPPTVAQAVTEQVGPIVENSVAPVELSIATAYFNVGGFEQIASVLERAVERGGHVRLLLGAEPKEWQTRATITPQSVLGASRGDPRLAAAIAEHSRALAEDRDLVGFGQAADEKSERLIRWLRSGRVEVRRLERGFLHGKAFISTTPSQSAVMAGSANLTAAGLTRNRELDLGVYSPSGVRPTLHWFNVQWEEAVPFDLAGLYEARRVPQDPWHVFLRMLDELYGRDLGEDTRTDNELGLTEFQMDGVWRAKRILRHRGGVIVADEVGLGKTFLAGELIREATIDRRQKVLVVAPATLRQSTWQPFRAEKNLPFDVVSYEELARHYEDAGRPGSPIPQDLNAYAMVVVDEAHNLRNPKTARADALRALLRGRVRKDLVLLTATPVNNSLLDLQTLVSYIDPSDAAFADVGVPKLSAYIRRAMEEDPDDLSGADLFDVVDAIAVRRTRRFIETQYPTEQIHGHPITFPRAQVTAVTYELSSVLPGYFEELRQALGAHVKDEDVALNDVAPREPGTYLTMARYVPSRYQHGVNLEQYQVQNAGLLQSALLKRFESSWVAYSKTLRTMIRSHDQFLEALGRGYVLVGDALREYAASDSDDVDDLLASLSSEAQQNVAPASVYDVAALRAAVASDRDVLRQLLGDLGPLRGDGAGVSRADPKIDALCDQLATIAQVARRDGVDPQDARNRRKVVVFTYFADTARYIADALEDRCLRDPRLDAYRGRVVEVTGRDRDTRQQAIAHFAPLTVGRQGGVLGSGLDSEEEQVRPEDDLYDIAVATDVLSEGVNLQQAGHIINYDLPWNPQRLVQRQGRIDRIGSPHARIYSRCFFPDADLENMLDLEGRLQRKLKQAAAAFGVGDVLPGVRYDPVSAVDRNISETRAQIHRLQLEDASALDDPSAGTTGEEYRRRLQRAFQASPATKRAVLGLPLGAGTGFRRTDGRQGVVYCIRVADKPEPFFRFVPLDTGDDGVPKARVLPGAEGDIEIRAETLTSLIAADPGGSDTPADLPAPFHTAALDLWPTVQDAVYQWWMEQTDPANLEPAVPKPMRDAADYVRAHGGFLGEGQEHLERALRQQVSTRIQREVRDILKDSDQLACGTAPPSAASDIAPPDTRAAKTTVNRIRTIVQDEHLSEPAPVQPLPPITQDDIRVVAWAAIHR